MLRLMMYYIWLIDENARIVVLVPTFALQNSIFWGMPQKYLKNVGLEHPGRGIASKTFGQFKNLKKDLLDNCYLIIDEVHDLQVNDQGYEQMKLPAKILSTTATLGYEGMVKEFVASIFGPDQDVKVNNCLRKFID